MKLGRIWSNRVPENIQKLWLVFSLQKSILGTLGTKIGNIKNWKNSFQSLSNQIEICFSLWKQLFGTFIHFRNIRNQNRSLI